MMVDREAFSAEQQLDLTSLENSLNDAKRKIKANKIELHDVKTRAKILKGILDDYAAREKVELKNK